MLIEINQLILDMSSNMEFYKLDILFQSSQMIYATLFNLLSVKNLGSLSSISFPKAGFLEATILESDFYHLWQELSCF